MSKVHFAALVRISFDLDLLEHWCKWYERYAFDTYRIFFDPEGSTDAQRHLAFTIAKHYGYKSEMISGEFRCGHLRAVTLTPYHNSLPLDDYLVTADSDEFQQVGYDYRMILEESEGLKGHLIDRYDDTLHDALPVLPLNEQYPHKGYIEELIEQIPNWPAVKRNKVLACKCKHKVEYSGSHIAWKMNGLFEKEELELHGDYEVHHYSYRGSYIDRMAGKAYFQSDHICAMMNFFNKIEPENRSLLKKIEDEKRIQQDKGWVPSGE